MSANTRPARLSSLVRDLVPWIAELHVGMRTVPRSLPIYVRDVLTSRTPQLRYADNDTLREAALMLHQLACWYFDGLPVFRPTHDLLAALLLTDPAGVTPEEIRRPYETFVIDFPQDWPWRLQDGAGRACPVRLGWVHAYRGGEQELGLQLQIVAEAPPSPEFQTSGTNDLVLHDRLPDLAATTNLQSWLNDRHGPPLAFGQIRAVATDATDDYLQKAMRRLYVNFCLYIAEKGKGKRLPDPPGRKRKSPRLAAVRRPAIWLPGTEIKLPAPLKAAAHAWTTAKRGQKLPWHVQRRWTVRGHWRMQACGPARQDRKRLWIAPYWKGPPEGVRIGHLYTVDNGEVST